MIGLVTPESLATVTLTVRCSVLPAVSLKSHLSVYEPAVVGVHVAVFPVAKSRITVLLALNL